jgi:gluconolactonase
MEIMNYRNIALALLAAVSLNGSAQDEDPEKPSRESSRMKAYPWMGKIERLDPAINNLLGPDAMIEKLAEGFDWSEGPVWMKRGNFLLFSDVPRNVVFRWKQGEKTRPAVEPSGYTGSSERGGEPGSNGLTVDKLGRLVLCQHGDRQVARLDKGKFVPIAQYYQGRRFNSPNDLVYKSNGDLYFTDPPYGLLKLNDDPNKELVYNGVYRVTPKGTVTLLTSELTFPNGIAFSPDEQTLYVAVSDPDRAIYMAYPMKKDGTLDSGRVLFDATPLAKQGLKGLPDGLKVDQKGNLWASGPGGILVLTPEGKHLGTIFTGEATANCAWGDDGSTLYITADMFLCRVKTKTKGLGF